MVRPLTVYKASAGSGKTFTLATEYIRLLVENPQSYRHILAVTFTNKATEEMKRRILSQLYGIWQHLPESDRYLAVVRTKTGLTEETIRERAGLALHQLIYNYTDFRVMTIDTFFQGVLRNLARELDLTANLRIGLNDVQVEEMAVDQMIEHLKTTDVLLQWLMGYIMENISDDRSWNVIGQIKKFGRTIFKDDYKAVSAEIQQKMTEPGFFDRYTTLMKETRQTARQQMLAISDEFFGILEKEGFTIDDFSFGKSGVAGVFQKLREGASFDESLIGKRALDSVGDPVKWVKKTHPQRDRLLILVESQLDPLLHRLIENQPLQWCLYQSADLTLRHLNQLRLLGSIEQKIRQLNEENNRFLLSDTQHLLHTLIDGSDSPFIFEKIGTQLEQVMIDEFQDTSTVQWENFRILMAEAMSHQQSGNLIVGDVKQSIYRWRSGDWRLLNDIEAQFPHPDQQMEVKNLDTNYRSDRRIVAFNNAFFTHAAELEYLALGSTPEANQLRKAYADVIQQVPADRPDEGFVSISLLPDKGQDMDYKERTLCEIASNVSALLAEGAAPNEIAILVRTNAYIPVIARYFIEHLPEVTIVSDEAFRLDASSAVCLLIDALRLLLHPDDLLTKATLAKRYQRQVLGNNLTDTQLLMDEGYFAGAGTFLPKTSWLVPRAECFFEERSCSLPHRHKEFNELFPEEFVASFNDLRSMPLYELVERLYRIFALDRLEFQSAYICTFFDYLTDYLSEASVVPLRKHSARGGTTSQDVFERNYTGLEQLKAFLNEWDETLCGKTIQSDEITGIRLISIHKSKGLEFPHVIIPFCDWSLEHPGILWAAPSQTEDMTFLSENLPLVPVDYSQKQLTGTIFEAAYNHEHLQTVVDNLNLLYVAFTRASKSLHVLGKRNAKNSRSTLIEQVLPLIAESLPNATLEGLDAEDAPFIFRLTGVISYQNVPEPKRVQDLSSKSTPHEEVFRDCKIFGTTFDSCLAERDKQIDTRCCLSVASSSSGSENITVGLRDRTLLEERSCTRPHSNPFLQSPMSLPLKIATYENKVEFRQSNRSKAFMEGEDENSSTNYLKMGSILHEVFSNIRTTADIDRELKRLELEGVLYDDQHTSEKITAMLRKRLEHPKVAEWFSDKWTLFNECTILTRVDGQLVERRPDRVMTDGHQWIIVDFKFGSPKPEHESQVREYMSLIREMHSSEDIIVNGYLWYIYSNKVLSLSF